MFCFSPYNAIPWEELMGTSVPSPAPPTAQRLLQDCNSLLSPPFSALSPVLLMLRKTVTQLNSLGLWYWETWNSAPHPSLEFPASGENELQLNKTAKDSCVASCKWGDRMRREEIKSGLRKEVEVCWVSVAQRRLPAVTQPADKFSSLCASVSYCFAFPKLLRRQHDQWNLRLLLFLGCLWINWALVK